MARNYHPTKATWWHRKPHTSAHLASATTQPSRPFNTSLWVYAIALLTSLIAIGKMLWLADYMAAFGLLIPAAICIALIVRAKRSGY